MNKKSVRLFAIAVTGTAAAIMLVAKAQSVDRPVPMKITCVNNLRRINVAFEIWAGDHGDQFPWNVSTNQGGTRELSQADAGGFALNPVPSFQVLTNDDALTTPLVLVCPDDKTHKAAVSLATLKAENITYKLRIGTIVEGNSNEVLLVCPTDGNTLRCDGTVVDGKGQALPKAWLKKQGE